mgnify:CR=1 FL=1
MLEIFHVIVIILDKGRYHYRMKFCLPIISTKQEHIVSFMNEHNNEVPDQLPVKSVLLSMIRSANIQMILMVHNIARELGHEVLRLLPYHCVLNLIEMIWISIKAKVGKNKRTLSLSPSVCAVLRQSVDNVSTAVRSKFINHTIKIEDEYILRNLQNDSEQFVINLQESDEVD